MFVKQLQVDKDVVAGTGHEERNLGGGGFRAGRANVEIATFNNIPHGIRKVFQMKSNKFLGR